MLLNVGQALAELAPVLGWKRSLPQVQRYFRTGVRAVRPTDLTTDLIDDATRARKTTAAHHAAAATAWAELERRTWGMQALLSRSTLPLHRHLGNRPELDRLISIVLAGRVDGAAGVRLTYEQGASEIGKSRSTWWRRISHAEEGGWIGHAKHVAGPRGKRQNKTNLYYPGPTLLARLADPEVGKALAREAEIEAYKKQRGTDPKPKAEQGSLLPDLEAADDCPAGAWSETETQASEAPNESAPETDPNQLAFLALLEEVCEPPTSAERPAEDYRRVAAREGWQLTEEGSWLLPVESSRGDNLDVVMTDVDLENFLSRRHASRIATTTAEFKKLSEETDQDRAVRRDRAERTARRGRGLPAPTRLQLDDGAAQVLEAMMRRAQDPGMPQDPELRRIMLDGGARVDAGRAQAHPETEALAVLVARATARGSPHGARVGAFNELARAIAAMPAAPPGLARLEGTLRHVLKDYPESGTDDEDGAS